MRAVTAYQIPTDTRALAVVVLVTLDVWFEVYPPTNESIAIVIKTSDTPKFAPWKTLLQATPFRGPRGWPD